MNSILIRNGVVVAMDPARTITHGDVYIEDGVIQEFPSKRQKADEVIDAADKLVLPGFVQTHIHLNQTLFRGLSEDLVVEDWLRLRIWPLEQAHDAESLYDAARLGIAEMIRGGTTCALTNETVQHTDSAFEAIIESGFRAVAGKMMMDRWEVGTEMLGETTDDSMRESMRLLEKYHGRENGRVSYAFCPRGTRNITDELWRDVVQAADEHGILIHCHCGDGKAQTVRLSQESLTEFRYLESVGAPGPNLVLAHCIWLDDEELGMMAESDTKATHCPSANLKVASGLAKVPEMLELGVNVSLGADGAPANNNLDMFMEMRLAGLIHKPRLDDERTMPASTVLEMATIGGARALGMDDKIGSIEAGKLADVIVVERGGLHNQPMDESDPMTQVVYQLRSSDVDTVIVDGNILLRDGEFVNLDVNELRSSVASSVKRVMKRANLADL